MATLTGVVSAGCGDDGGDGGKTAGTGGSGGSSGGGGTAGSSGGACSVATADIALNHGHVLTVSAEDVSAGVDKTYDIQGTSVHTHTVTLTHEEFAKLAAGENVVVTTGEGAAHTHTVTVTCA